MIPSRLEEEDYDDSDSDDGSDVYGWAGYQRRLTLSYQQVEVPDDFQLSSDDLSDDLPDVSNGREYVKRCTI